MKSSSFALFALLTLSPAFVRAAVTNDPNSDSPRAGIAAVAKPSESTTMLWIAVHLPKDTKASWVSDDMAATFADTVASALRAQGYKGKFGTLRPDDSTPSRANVLVIRLDSWSAKDGIADCSFTASLRTTDGDRDLGLFEGDNMIVTSDGEHKISSDGLIGSAQEALNDLYGRIKGTGLLKNN